MWKHSYYTIFLITMAAMLGKAGGGILGDYLGWTKTGTIVLIFSTLFFIFSPQNIWSTFIGVLLLQMTMPLTLVVLYKIFPEKPGLTFGLSCLSLIIGGAPTFSSWAYLLKNINITVIFSILSVLTFFMGSMTFICKENLHFIKKSIF